MRGITLYVGYAQGRAPEQKNSRTRRKTKELFRAMSRIGGPRRGRCSQSPLFMDFLAGNREYHCTPWGNPTRNVFGWQRPCYLLSEGYADSFKALMAETAWESYGTGNYEKCANCMAHCGYEATAVMDTLAHPAKALVKAVRGVGTEGPMVPEIPLARARPAEYIFERHVEEALSELHGASAPAASTAAKSGSEGANLGDAA